ncbi:MAG: L,D-transpeptidase [Elusimicrobiota bacterium]|jgi:L,D-transpeptidase YbiS
MRLDSSKIWTLLAILWLLAFGYETVLIARQIAAWWSTHERVERVTRLLQENAGEVIRLTRGIRDQSDEITFLQKLIDVIPQEKGFVRTQRAIADEVNTLRVKIGRRIHDDLHILVDTRANKLYVKKGLGLLWQADCSVGRGGFLKDKVTGRRWEFVTPRGQFEILGKIEKPIWTKPDWAFVENGEIIPPPDDLKRQVEGELGAYVLNLGDGYLIHGTKNEALLGRSVSHGCVRLGAEDLKRLYETVPRGVRVYIY